jgi:hypothetical protein
LRSLSGATGLKSRRLAPIPPELDVWADFHIQEVAVKAPRIRIAWVMVAVAIAALDFGVMREVVGSRSARNILLLLGILPMANVLTVGMLINQRRPGNRPFLLGFEVFGAMALILYIALAYCFDHGVETTYLRPLIDLLKKTIGQDRPNVFISVLYVGSMLMLGCPQLVFALIGGFLSRRIKAAITRH